MEELEDEADLLAPHARQFVVGQAGHVAAVEVVAAAVGAVEQADDVEQRGLAGAGRPHDGEVFAGRDVEADAAQGMHFLVADGEDALDAGECDHLAAVAAPLSALGFGDGLDAGLHAFAVERGDDLVARGQARS